MGKQSVYHNLHDLDKLAGNCNIVIIHGNKSYETSNAKTYFDGISGITYQITVKESNPKVNVLTVDYDKIKDMKYNMIIAVGGGSVIDTAKYMIYKSLEEKRYCREQITFAAIPTTAGSGSEATPFAVYYNNKKEKCSLDIQELLPDIVVLEPNLLTSLPKYQKACCIADAFCQAMESFWSVKANEESKKYSRDSLTLINKIIIKYVNGCDQYIKEALYGSYLAGKAIAITRTTISHALSYPITSHWHIAHGHAVSLTISECLMMNRDCISDRDKQYLCDIFGVNSLPDLKEYLDKMFMQIGLERRLSNLGIEYADIDTIIKEVNIDRLSNNPYKPKYEELHELLLRIS